MKPYTVTNYSQILLIIIITSLTAIDLSQASTDLEIPVNITTYGEAWNGTLAFGLFQYDPDDNWTPRAR